MQGDQLVSIVLCTLNGRSFIYEQLQSLASQTYPFLEFICIDNGSEDGTDLIVEKWCLGHPARKFLRHKEKGINKAFFKGISLCEGYYIGFCDQDDIWHSEKVARLVAFYQKHADSGMIYCLSNSERGLPSGESPIGDIVRLEGTDVRKTMFNSYTLGHNMLIRKTVLNKIPDPGNEVVAFDWWITVSAMCISPIRCLSQELTYWRRHASNTTIQINDVYYHKSRVGYMEQFLQNPLITYENRRWIEKAIESFRSNKNVGFSLKAFLFLLGNASVIFFYKRKSNPVLKWISFLKWSFRISQRNFRPR